LPKGDWDLRKKLCERAPVSNLDRDFDPKGGNFNSMLGQKAKKKKKGAKKGDDKEQSRAF